MMGWFNHYVRQKKHLYKEGSRRELDLFCFFPINTFDTHKVEASRIDQQRINKSSKTDIMPEKGPKETPETPET